MLLRHWVFVFAVWTLPGSKKTWNVSYTYSNIAGNKGCIGLYTGSGALDRCGGHLDICAYRLAAGGCDGVYLLLEKFRQEYVLIYGYISAGTLCLFKFHRNSGFLPDRHFLAVKGSP